VSPVFPFYYSALAIGAKIIEKCPCEGQKAGKYFRCRLKSEIVEAADHFHNAYNHLLNNGIELIRRYRSYSVTGPSSAGLSLPLRETLLLIPVGFKCP
jgi:hypothetical protein